MRQSKPISLLDGKVNDKENLLAKKLVCNSAAEQNMRSAAYGSEYRETCGERCELHSEVTPAFGPDSAQTGPSSK